MVTINRRKMEPYAGLTPIIAKACCSPITLRADKSCFSTARMPVPPKSGRQAPGRRERRRVFMPIAMGPDESGLADLA
jgi:hypothetical protein